MSELPQLTDSDYAEILQKCFHNPYITPSRTEFLPFSKKIEGLASIRYILKIFYKLDDFEQHESFFVKTIPSDPNILPIYIRAYKKEEFFYKTLLKKFSELGLDISFTPKFFLGKDGEVLVLENLKENGFENEERLKFFDMEQLRSCLDSLAVFHGSSFVYELKTGKNLELEYPEEFREYFFDENEEAPAAWFATSIPLWSRLAEDYLERSEDFKRLIAQADYHKMFKEKTNYRKISGHGDCWTNNIMFKRLNTKKLKVKLIDYQLMSFEERQGRFLELVDYYYEQLSEVLSKHGCQVEEVLTKCELLETIEFVRFTATLQYASCCTLTMMPESTVGKIAVKFPEWVRTDRYDCIKQAIDIDEGYKKVIVDCLKDLEVALHGK